VAQPLHSDEIPIDADLVRGLVDRAMPAYAGSPVRRLAANGSTNALYRLGDELLVRLPRQPGGSSTISKEATWLPVMAPLLPFSVPEVVAVFDPDRDYPSVGQSCAGSRVHTQRWSIPGRPSTRGANTSRRTWPQFWTPCGTRRYPTRALHDPRLWSYRGEPLATMDQATRENIERCRALENFDLDLDAGRADLGRRREAARSSRPRDAELVPRRPRGREPVGA
jgi:hypothetical protein